MSYATSFINEHSAEFVLVPALAAELAPHFESVVPLYFWLNREGGRMARASLGASSVRLLTVYARRPKVRYPGDHEILMRVNLELYEAAQVADEMGCPILAGIPLVNDLKSLVVGVQCRWFHVRAIGASGAMSDVVHLDARTGELLEQPFGLSVLRTGDLVEVARSANRISWAEAVEVVRALRVRRSQERGWWSGATYKPFHMLILDG